MFLALVLLLGVSDALFLLNEAKAHGGQSIEQDVCVFSAGHYNLHFSSYIVDEFGGKEYCWDIPQTGEIFFVLDFIDKSLRDKLTEFKIIRKAASTESIYTDEVVVVKSFSKNTTGSLNISANIDDAGQYEAVFIISDDDEVTDVHLPISVGVGNSTQNMPYLLFVFVGVLLLLFFAYKRYLR